MRWILENLREDFNVDIAKMAKNLEKSNTKEVLQKAIAENLNYRVELFSFWNDNSDAVGVVFMVTHLAKFDWSLLEMTVYSKYGYKVSQVLLSFKTVDELFEWFQKKDTLKKCAQVLMELNDTLRHLD